VFRRPPWKELSCKLQTALAQAQQEHGFCVKHAVCGYKQLFKRGFGRKNIGFVQTTV